MSYPRFCSKCGRTAEPPYWHLQLPYCEGCYAIAAAQETDPKQVFEYD